MAAATRVDYPRYVSVDDKAMAEQQLFQLLQSMFQPSELRRFLRHRADYALLCDALPGVEASFNALVDAAIQPLHRHGLITRRLFDELLKERPHRSVDVQRVAAVWDTQIADEAKVAAPERRIEHSACLSFPVIVGEGSFLERRGFRPGPRRPPARPARRGSDGPSRPPGRRCAGRPVELKIGDWVQGVGQELPDLEVSEAHGECTTANAVTTDRRREWRGGQERGHPAGPQAHDESGRHGAGLVRRCRDSDGQAQAVLEHNHLKLRSHHVLHSPACR
jgi:hypothetical protein